MLNDSQTMRIDLGVPVASKRMMSNIYVVGFTFAYRKLE